MKSMRRLTLVLVLIVLAQFARVGIADGAANYDAAAAVNAAPNSAYVGELGAADELVLENSASVPAGTKWYWPAPASSPHVYSDGSWLSSPFGWRELKQSMHNGIDVRRVTSSTPIYASRAGTLYPRRTDCTHNYAKSPPKYSDPCSSAGNWVIIDHQDGTYSAYMHMSSVVVKAQQSVKQGQLIGYCGTTGSSTGNHLHFEVRVGAKNAISNWSNLTPIDPMTLTYIYSLDNPPSITPSPKPTPSPEPTPKPGEVSLLYQVNAWSGLTLRAEPSTSSSRLCTIPNNAIINVSLTISANGAAWGKTEYSGQSGWCALEYASLVGAAPTAAPVLYKVSASGGLSLRALASLASTRLATIPDGTIIAVTARTQAGASIWGETTYSSKAGWCSLDYASPLASHQPTSSSAPTQTPSPSPTALTYRVTAASGLSLRATASLVGERLAIMPNHTVIAVTQRTNIGDYEWGRTTYAGKSGWCALRYAKRVSDGGNAGEPEPTPSISATPEAAYVPPGSVYRVTAANGLALRASAGSSSSRISIIANGVEIVVDSQLWIGEELWGQVTYKGDVGWCALRYAELVRAAETSTPTATAVVEVWRISAVSLNVRVMPDVLAARVGVVAGGSKVRVMEKRTVAGALWGRIEYNGVSGWCMLKYAEPVR